MTLERTVIAIDRLTPLALLTLGVVGLLAGCSSAQERADDVTLPEALTSEPLRPPPAVTVAATSAAPKRVAPGDDPSRAGDDPVTAERLFREGRELMAQGNTAEGCAKFEASYRAEQATGTLFNVANCQEQLGRRAEACRSYRLAAKRASPGDARSRLADDRAQALGCPP